MPDLGPYAADVALAYAATAVLLAGLVAYVLVRGRRVRRALEELEDRRGT